MKRLFLSCLVLFLTTYGFSYSQLGQMLIGAQVGYNHPLQDLDEIAKSGFGFAGTFEVEVLPNIAAFASIGYNIWSSKISYSVPPYGSLDLSLSEIPINIGAKYYLKLPGFTPYAGLEFGPHILRAKLEVTGSLLGNSLDESESRTEFGFAPIIGANIPFSEKLLFGVNAKYTIVSTGSFNPDEEVDVKFHYASIYFSAYYILQ